jgi:nitroreductase
VSYLKYFNKPIDETIRMRISCRTYEDRLIDQEKKKELLDFCGTMNYGLKGERIEYHLVEFSVEELKDKKLSAYRLFKNVRSLIVGVIDRSESYHTSYGHAVEHVVLKATELGIGTCWAGYFDPYVIKDLKVNENQAIPAVILIGYAAEQQTLLEKIARFAIRASKRHHWNRLFFHGNFDNALSREEAGPHREALELLRLAPSAGNTQPWRIVKEKNQPTYHFLKKVVNPGYEKRKLHDIDIGIAMCHFELGAAKNGLEGHWERIDPRIPNLPVKTTYMISWIHNAV